MSEDTRVRMPDGASVPERSETTDDQIRFGQNGEERPVLPNRTAPRSGGVAGTCGDPGPHAGDANAMRYDADAPPEHPANETSTSAGRGMEPAPARSARER